MDHVKREMKLYCICGWLLKNAEHFCYFWRGRLFYFSFLFFPHWAPGLCIGLWFSKMETIRTSLCPLIQHPHYLHSPRRARAPWRARKLNTCSLEMTAVSARQKCLRTGSFSFITTQRTQRREICFLRKKAGAHSTILYRYCIRMLFCCFSLEGILKKANTPDFPVSPHSESFSLFSQHSTFPLWFHVLKPFLSPEEQIACLPAWPPTLMCPGWTGLPSYTQPANGPKGRGREVGGGDMARQRALQ